MPLNGLRSFAFAGTLALLVLAASVMAGAPDLDGLLKEYRALGLPLPPDDAKLVRYESGGGGLVDGKVQPKLFALAFELGPDEPWGRSRASTA